MMVNGARKQKRADFEIGASRDLFSSCAGEETNGMNL
jgi:hypothetical protein